MSFTVDLEDQLERQLRELAARQGVTPERLAARVLAGAVGQKDWSEATEAELLNHLGLGLSETEWRRYHSLISLREQEALIDEQQAALTTLSDRLERANAERVAVLAELAKRRGMTLPQVMDELGIYPPDVR